MPFRFPKFTDTFCESFTACGEIRGASDELKSWLSGQDSMKVRYRVVGQMPLVQLLTGGKNGAHLHFDVSLPSWFIGRTPKSTHKRSDIEKVIAKVSGMRIDVNVQAFMKAEKEVISSPVFALLQQHDVPIDDDKFVSVKFTGFEIDQKESGFGKISVLDADDSYLVRFSFDHEAVIGDAYLPSILNRIDSIFKSIFNVGQRS